MVVNTSNICDCAPNAYPDPVNKGQCLACWENAIYNATTSTCECQPGYYLSVPKTCTIRPSCLNGAKFDYAKKTCVCVNVGQVIINNKCVCPAGQVYS